MEQLQDNNELIDNWSFMPVIHAKLNYFPLLKIFNLHAMDNHYQIDLIVLDFIYRKSHTDFS